MLDVRVSTYARTCIGRCFQRANHLCHTWTRWRMSWMCRQWEIRVVCACIRRIIKRSYSFRAMLPYLCSDLIHKRNISRKEYVFVAFFDSYHAWLRKSFTCHEPYNFFTPPFISHTNSFVLCGRHSHEVRLVSSFPTFKHMYATPSRLNATKHALWLVVTANTHIGDHYVIYSVDKY